MTIDLSSLATSTAAAVLGVRTGRRGGTGTLVTAAGAPVVLTTAHNITGRAPGAAVHLVRHDGSRTEGRLAAASEDHDLAVITLAGDADLADVAPLAWGDPTGLAVGAPVAAAAAPDGVLRLTAGTVATLASRVRTRTGSPVDAVLEHTAPLVRGASGGPVLDAAGAVVGIDVNRLEGGLYQAVSATAEVRALVDALAEGHVPEPRRLGVTVVPGRRARWIREAAGLPPRDGVLLADVADGSPAATAGLRRGDLLTALDGTPLRTPDDLLLALRRTGDTADLAYTTAGTDDRQVTLTW